jgi:preprotein translocase subunit SecA
VTLATNIAGRGTDIVLEPGVAELGGLHVLGTERHESRRIDNQLRGRSGRQGDPGSSQFYVSLEDDLMRIFGSERIAGIMDTLGLDDETPIENKLVSKSLESAQKKVEGHNFDTRKQLVEYDDVMNRHREVIYSRRRKALVAESMQEEILGMIRKEVSAMVVAHTDSRTNEVQYPELGEAISSIMPVGEELAATVRQAHESELTDIFMDAATALYEQRIKEFPPGTMRMAERFTYINSLDRLWIEHLEAMDSLRGGIGLRAIGQKDPLVEYKREGFRMFKQLIALLDADVATTIFKVTVRQEEVPLEVPVQTALTRAAQQAQTNAGGEIAASYDRGGNETKSRSERRAKAVTVGGGSATKKHKKRR